MHAIDRVCFITDLLRTTVLDALLSFISFLIVNQSEMGEIRRIAKYLIQISGKAIWYNIKVKLSFYVFLFPFSDTLKFV